MSATEAWEWRYQNRTEFVEAGVVFSQFAAQLKDHCKQVKMNLKQAKQEEGDMIHERNLFP